MAKGAQAKVNVQNIIAKAFGEDWIGEVNKKLYVWADDGGERVQISIALTCPKTPVAAPDKNFVPDNDWSIDDSSAASIPVAKVEVSDEEKKNLSDLMARLGL